MTTTSIEWTRGDDGTAGKVWNPTTGCDKVSQGCKNCYAETIADRFWAKQYPPNADGSPRKFTDVRCHEDRLEIPLKWKNPARIFVNSMSDLFHEDVPADFIDRVFAVMALCPQHTFQVLTKRPDRMLEYLGSKGQDALDIGTREEEVVMRWGAAAGRLLDGDWIWGAGERFRPQIEHFIATAHGLADDGEMLAEDEVPFPLPNVWLGVSVEDQKAADERIPLLLQTPAAVRWISAEPLLGPVDLTCCQHRREFEVNALTGDHGVFRPLQGRSDRKLDWVVCGGESGHGARPMHLSWMRGLVTQCKAAEVPVFVKQLGSVPVMDEQEWRNSPTTRMLTAKNRGRTPEGTVPIWMSDNKGADIACFPSDLQIREYPTTVGGERGPVRS